MHRSTAALEDLSLCSSPFRFPRRPSQERPPLPVAGSQLNGRMRLCETERAVSPAGRARARCSAAPGAVRGMGVGGEDRIRSYGGWRGRAATWGPVSLRRASRAVRKRVGTAVLRPAGLLGRGRPSLWRVCVSVCAYCSSVFGALDDTDLENPSKARRGRRVTRARRRFPVPQNLNPAPDKVTGAE